MAPLYFGCWHGVGHYLHDARGQTMFDRDLERIDGRHIDTGFCPSCFRHSGDRSYQCNSPCQEQGLARLTHATARGTEVTILAFWDRTLDRRGGSHSTFILPGTLDFAQAVAVARTTFPAIWQRLDRAGVVVRGG